MPANTEAPASPSPARGARRGRGVRPVPLIAVIGGCGGAGASTLAVSLAVTALGVGRRAILFDADPLGGGLESLVALGTVTVPSGERIWTTRAWPYGVDPPEPRRSPDDRRDEPDLALVTWGGAEGERIPVEAMRNAVRALRASADVVVVDLPRVVDDATQLVLSEATHTLVIAPVSERTAVSTSRLLPKLSMVGPRPQLVARLPGRDELTAREFANLLDAPLAGIVRPGRNAVPKRASLPQLGGRSATSLARFSHRIIERCVSLPAAADHFDHSDRAGRSDRTQVSG